MAITGISAISGGQIIAAGAVSARKAATAAFTTGGNDIQNLYDTVSTNSASWTGGGGGGEYISAEGFAQHITNTANNKYLSFWNEAGGATATAYPAIYLNGQFSSAYYKDNELKLGRAGHMIAFNIGGAGPKISAAATGNADAYMMLYNTKASATLNQSGLNIKNSTSNENVTIASIQSWNAKGDMHESAFTYDTDNNITAYNGSAFKAGGVATSAGIVGDGSPSNPIRPDETVLYSGTRGVSGRLLDNPFNYDRIRIYLDLGHQNENPGRSDPSFEYPMRGTTANNRINLFYAKGNDNAWFSVLQLNITPTSFSAIRSKSINMNSYDSTTNTFTASNNSTEDLQAVVKIVGINRKEV